MIKSESFLLRGKGVKALKIRLFAITVLFGLLLTVSASAAFRDVPENHWCAEPIREMETRGFLAGYADGTFRPANPVTAAQFVTILSRCTKLEPASGEKNHWAADAMRAALRAGWYDWDELPPSGERFDLPIPRFLAVKILMKALLPDMRGDYLTESQKIKDFQLLDGRYYESVLAAYSGGVLLGDSSGCFRPNDGLSRAAACAIVYRALQKASVIPTSGGETAPQPESAVSRARGGVAENGWLQVKGAQLCNEAGEAVILRGMSSHGLQWYGQFTSAQAIRNLAACGANLFRVAMYTAEGGYLDNPKETREKVIAAVDAAIANNLYVIIDWHILSDGNPMSHQDEAAAFFADMSERYRDCPAVLYEICNEPNGNVTWERDIKPYAEKIAGVIRERSPRAVILIGNSTWSQDIHIAAKSPLEGDNFMYTFHFYAGTHGESLRQRLRDAVSNGLPVFVSEWGTSQADGSGGVYLEESAAWLELLDELGVSWANWSLCDKNETSAALRPGTAPDAVWTENDLSESGAFVFARFAESERSESA